MGAKEKEATWLWGIRMGFMEKLMKEGPYRMSSILNQEKGV